MVQTPLRTALPEPRGIPTPRLSRTILVVVGSLLILSAGCRRNRYDVPVRDNAKSQFLYALKLDEEYRSPLFKSSTKEAGRIAVAAYRQVIDSFPNETAYVNRARFGIALIDDLEGRERKALRVYEKLLEDCPNDDVIQINALFSAARIHDVRKNFEKSKKYYRTIVERYSKNPNPEFQSKVYRSRIMYGKIRAR